MTASKWCHEVLEVLSSHSMWPMPQTSSKGLNNVTAFTLLAPHVSYLCWVQPINSHRIDRSEKDVLLLNSVGRQKSMKTSKELQYKFQPLYFSSLILQGNYLVLHYWLVLHVSIHHSVIIRLAIKIPMLHFPQLSHKAISFTQTQVQCK